MVSTTSVGWASLQGHQDGFLTWLQKIIDQRTEQEQKLINFACDRVKDSAEYEHCVQRICLTVDILVDMGLDCETLVAAMLYPLAEHHGLSLAEIEGEFSPRIALLVGSVLKMSSMDELGKPTPEVDHNSKQQTEMLRKMLLAMAEDVRAVLIKLAERLYQLRMLRYETDEIRRKTLAQHTLNIYTPLANRLGIWQVKWEMEDLSLRYIEPDNYTYIAKRLELRRVEREAFINEVKQTVQEMLAAENIHAEVTGRPKHIYSIWRKMSRKGVDFSQVFDVHAVRVIVENPRDCYTILGLIHNRWTPIPGEFDDYIANPKSNGYKSLHTAVIGPGHRIFEAQIRTRDMHERAELGVASHWRYKEGVAHDEDFERKLAWLRQLLDWKEEGREDNELLLQLDSNVFDQRIYVLTPQGQVVDLPQTATPLDFAYYIHTDLGHHCKGAKVNERMVSLSYQLRTGDRVEILQAKQERVNQDWLNPNRGYLNTTRARAKVRQWLKLQNTSRHLADGRAALERELKRLNVHSLAHGEIAKHFGFGRTEELFIALGRGDINTAQLANAIHRLLLPTSPPTALRKRSKLHPHNKVPHTSESYSLDTFAGIVTRMAKCCNPKPNDELVAYVSTERGIVIHCRDCANVRRWMEEGNEKLIELESQPSAESTLYEMSIELQAYDRLGLINDVSQVLREEKINITDLNTHTGVDKVARMIISVEVEQIAHLNEALTRLEQLPNVVNVRRHV